MSKKDEALKLALEALDGLEALLLSMGLTHLIVYGDAEKAITALREALAEQPTDWEAVAADQAMTIALLRAEQPAQQEPVFWAISYDGKTPYALWPDGDGALFDLEIRRQGGTASKMPLYTSPPAQRKPLTDEEMADFLGCRYHTMSQSDLEFFRLGEAAHGIKENT